MARKRYTLSSNYIHVCVCNCMCKHVTEQVCKHRLVWENLSIVQMWVCQWTVVSMLLCKCEFMSVQVNVGKWIVNVWICKSVNEQAWGSMQLREHEYMWVCACVCTWVCKCGSMHVCKWRPGSTLLLCSSFILYFVLWKQSLSLAWGSPADLCPADLCFSGTGITSVCHCAWLFYVGS